MLLIAIFLLLAAIQQAETKHCQKIVLDMNDKNKWNIASFQNFVATTFNVLPGHIRFKEGFPLNNTAITSFHDIVDLESESKGNPPPIEFSSSLDFLNDLDVYIVSSNKTKHRQEQVLSRLEARGFDRSSITVLEQWDSQYVSENKDVVQKYLNGSYLDRCIKKNLPAKYAGAHMENINALMHIANGTKIGLLLEDDFIPTPYFRHKLAWTIDVALSNTNKSKPIGVFVGGCLATHGPRVVEREIIVPFLQAEVPRQSQYLLPANMGRCMNGLLTTPVGAQFMLETLEKSNNKPYLHGMDHYMNFILKQNPQILAYHSEPPLGIYLSIYLFVT